MSSKNIKTIFTLERRSFLKWSALAGTAGMVMNFDEAMAAGECTTMLDPRAVESVNAAMGRMGLIGGEVLSEAERAKATAINREFFYWFDGPMVDGMARAGQFRGRLAVFLDMKLSDSSEYLESVALCDQDRVILEERRMHAGARGKTGKAPYVVFDNLMLQKVDYHVYFVIGKVGSTAVRIYRYTIKGEDVRQSRYDYAHLSEGARAQIPAEFINEMRDAGHVTKEKPEEFGLVTTPYQHSAALPLHIVRAHFKSMDASGNFSILIEPMHADQSEGHYMRYFAVLDPVGRFLGVKRRVFNESNAAHTVGTVTYGDRKFYNISQGVNIPAAEDTLGLREKYGSRVDPAGQEVNITDCPYVQVVTEDKQDSISRISIRLR